MDIESIRKIYDKLAPERQKWRSRNRLYHDTVFQICKENMPPEASVLHIGSGTGALLHRLRPKRGLGFDISPVAVKIAKENYPELEFRDGSEEDLSKINEKFDYVIISVSHLFDIWAIFLHIHKVLKPDGRLLVLHINYVWQPILELASKLHLVLKQPVQNYLPYEDIVTQLYLTDYKIIKHDATLIFPKNLKPFSAFLNTKAEKWPLLRQFRMIGYIIAVPESKPKPLRDMSCSVIVPCRNEVGNIENLVRRLPALSLNTEIIFIDGKSTDGTVEKIKEMIEKYKGIKQIILLHQKVCDGKASAVWQGFEAAQNEIFFILDSDLTVPPEDLPKFYRAIVQGKAAFVNGTRLVYPLEKEAMRFLNFLANKMFGLIFTWLLEQRIKDTLCGTKVLTKKNYERIKALSSYFGDFDPFGDFLLLFGASYLGLKIIEVPIRYQARTYGEIKIKRFKHGFLLLKMTIIAFVKLKTRKWFRKK